LLLRRSFLALSTSWAVALPLAAFAASRPAAGSAAYGFALAVYSIGRLICHQLPERSFHLWRATLPVCARCTGIYLGAAATAIVIAAASRRGSPSRRRRSGETKADPRAVLLIAFVPTAVTLIFEWTTDMTPANWIRALAGVPLGAAVAWAIGMVD
jgi:uncharacterized membrane protein